MTRASHDSGRSPDRPTGPGLPHRRELDLFDVVALGWLERGLIALVFAVIFAIGVVASLTLLKPSYEAETRLLVLLDEDPTPSTAGLGGAFMLDQVMQSESQLLGSAAVRQLALETLGAEAILGEPVTGSGRTAALKALRGGFSVGREPQSSVLTATFTSADAERSALVLNALVNAYLAYREQILIETGVTGLGERRIRADAAVQDSQAALDAFLRRHDLSNFETEKATMENLVGGLTDRLDAARASRDAALAGASALRERLNQIPANIELYVENGVSGVLLERRAERASLLSRYQPGAPAVAAVEREIEALENFIATGAADGEGQRRTGANPVRQTLESELATREADAGAAAALAASLETQLRDSRTEVTRLRSLESEYTLLAQDVAAAETAAAELAALEASASSRRAPGLGSADAVRVIDRATPPLDGSSMKKIGLVASFILAAGIAALVGLLRGYWRVYVAEDALARPRGLSARTDNVEILHPNRRSAPLEDERDPYDGLPVLARIGDRTA
ncbi:GumC family protein [Maricaulis sp. CAU 1757]